MHDLNLGGIVMMAEGVVVTLAALAWLFLRLAAEGELRQRLLEQGLDPRQVQRAVRYGRAATSRSACEGPWQAARPCADSGQTGVRPSASRGLPRAQRWLALSAVRSRAVAGMRIVDALGSTPRPGRTAR